MKLPNGGDLKPYPKTEDSCVEWLGKVPTHWGLLRSKFLFRCIDVRSRTGEEELLTVSSERGVVPRSSATVTMFQAESYVGYKLCWPGDLVINSLWAWGRGLGVSQYHGIVSSAYGVYRLRPPYSKYCQYIHRLVRSEPFNLELRVRSKGVWTSRLQLTDEAFLDTSLPVPPVEEQAAIVRFLDYANRRIRRYIRAKQKLIALLEEQKQAIIHRAVTGQIDVRTGQPYSAYKDSGAEWLGGVPEHWEVVALWRRWQVIDCKHLTVPFVDDGIPLASVREAQSFELDLTTSNRTTSEWYEELVEGGRKPRLGDLIYCRNVSVGAAALVTTEIPFAMGQDVCLLRSSAENHRWLNYFLQSKVMSDQLALILVGSTFNRINVADIRALLIAVPPVAEQDRIAVVLDDELNQIDVAIDVCLREQALFLEYRTRLIAEVVTGKLDVREAAAVLPEEDVYGDSEESAEEQESKKKWLHDGMG